MCKSNTNEGPKSRAARSEWYASIIEKQERDGISVVEAAKAAGVTPVTLYRWKKLLAAGSLPAPVSTQGLVRVEVNTDGPIPTSSANSILLKLRGNRSIVIPSGLYPHGKRANRSKART
ncbi:MAG: transposase [bacterium]|nr:transposase [bacterium]